MPNDANVALVTGGAGYVGSWLVRALLDQTAADVVVYDNLFNGKRGFVPDHPRVTLIEGDITNSDQVQRALAEHKPQWVFHLAALHYIPYCNAHPVETMKVNVVGTEVLLEACRRHVPQRLVAASSAAVYSPCDVANTEEDTPGPMDIYGLSKLANEQQLQLFSSRQPECRCVAARFFNVFGPRETNPHVIPEIVRQIHEGQDELELGNVKPKRDYVYVADVAAALVAMARKTAAPYRVYNVGTSVEHSVEEIVEELSRVSGRTVRIRVDPSRVRASERMHLLCDRTRIGREIGWKPEYTLASGIEELWKWTLAEEPATAAV